MADIMKKYKHGEMSKVADGNFAKEKPQASVMKKYSQGEFSGAGGKAPKDKLESWSSAKIKQGSHNS
tara:strand:+ start:100 stop:300 length:201 start_codon:yes stop_codon:yes gene_type:complete